MDLLVLILFIFRCVPRRANPTSGLTLESYVFNILYEVSF